MLGVETLGPGLRDDPVGASAPSPKTVVTGRPDGGAAMPEAVQVRATRNPYPQPQVARNAPQGLCTRRPPAPSESPA